MVWYSHLLKNFPQFVVIHTIKCYNIANEAEIDVFLESSLLFTILQKKKQQQQKLLLGLQAIPDFAYSLYFADP